MKFLFPLIFLFRKNICAVGDYIYKYKITNILNKDFFETMHDVSTLESNESYTFKNTLYLLPFFDLKYSTEVEILKKLNQRNLLKFISALKWENRYAIVFENVSFTLFNYPKIKQEKISITKQLLEGIIYLHRNNKTLDNINFKNIFVTSNGTLKLLCLNNINFYLADSMNLETEISKLNLNKTKENIRFSRDILYAGLIIAKIFQCDYLENMFRVEYLYEELIEKNYKDRKALIVSRINQLIKEILSRNVENDVIIKLILSFLNFSNASSSTIFMLSKEFLDLFIINQ